MKACTRGSLIICTRKAPNRLLKCFPIEVALCKRSRAWPTKAHAWPQRPRPTRTQRAHKGLARKRPRRPTKAQGGSQGPGPQGLRGPTRARPTRAQGSRQGPRGGPQGYEKPRPCQSASSIAAPLRGVAWMEACATEHWKEALWLRPCTFSAGLGPKAFHLVATFASSDN